MNFIDQKTFVYLYKFLIIPFGIFVLAGLVIYLAHLLWKHREQFKKWRNWPYWVKGGVISSFLAIIYYLSWVTFLFDLLPHDGKNPLTVIMLSPLLITSPFCYIERILGIYQYLGYCKFMPEFYLPSLINFVIPYFVVGIVLGWLYDKIKPARTTDTVQSGGNRKNNSSFSN